MSKAKTQTRKYASDAANLFWEKTLAGFALEDHHREILNTACCCLDRAEAAASIIAKEGVTCKGKCGEPQAHPAVKIERESRALFLRSVREMGLDLAEADAPAPPRRSGRSAR